MFDDQDIEYEVPAIPQDVFENPEVEEQKEGEKSEEVAVSKHPKLDKFLLKWDRSLAIDRRCFGIRLCFAGADGREYRDGLYRIGVRYILISYFYSRKWLKKCSVSDLAEDLGRFDFVFLDSGGFSFIQAINNGKDLGIDLESYTAEYYAEVERIGHLFAGCAEVDVHDKFTQYQMEEFKDKLLAKDVSIVPVIQPENAKVEVIKELGWFEKYPYIAFGSALIGNNAHTGDMIAINDYGRERGSLFHGFGATAADVLLRSKFFSVDSSVGGTSRVWYKESGVAERVTIESLYERFVENEISAGHESRVLTPDATTLTLVEENGEYVSKWVPLRSVVKHRVEKEFLKITLATGISLEVTADHSLFTMDKEGNLVETKPSSLNEGDWIVCPSRGVWPGKGISFMTHSFPIPGGQNRFHTGDTGTLTIELDTSMLEFLGYWVGNGSYDGETGINISCGLDKEPVALSQLIAERLNRKLTIHEKGDTSLSSYLFVRWMKTAGFPSGAHNKKFPDWFWSLSEEQACSMLRGYFSADGSAGSRPYCSSVSEELSDQVFAALFLMGIPCSKGLSNVKHHRVTISSDSAKELFAKKIGFICKRKEITYRKTQRVPYNLQLPAELALVRGRWDSGDLWAPEVKFVGRNYSRYFDKRVANESFNYLKITKIEQYPLAIREVYDLEVPGVERFLANEVLAHNTTWIGGSRFGNTMVFQNGRIRYYDHKHKDVRRRFKQRMEENGIVWKDIEEDKRKEVDLMNALAWKQWADSIRFNIQNSYWLTPEERDLALSLKAKAFNAEGLIDRTKSLARAEARRITQSTDASYDDRAMEVLHCDTCFLNGRCARYKQAEACGYDINVRLEGMADLHKAVQVMLEAEYGRVMTGILFEKAQGGVLDANVSNEMQKFLTMIQQTKVIFQPTAKEEIVIQAKSNQPGSIGKMLASVFSPMGSGGSGSGNTKTEQAANKIINVTPAKNSFMDDDSLDSE